MLCLSFIFLDFLYPQEWLVSFSHLNEVLNAEHISVGDKYVLADQRTRESESPIMTQMIFRYEVPRSPRLDQTR